MPSYNHARWLTSCLNSIRDQSLQSIQLILIDDCSPDDSFAVARQWCDAHWPDAILIAHSENLGLVPSLNEALRHATGTYIQITSSDDELLPEKLARQLALMEARPDAAICYGDMHLIDEFGAVRADSAIDWWDVHYQNRPGTSRLSGPVLKEVLSRRVPFCTPTWLIRRKSLDMVDGFDERFHQEDIPLLIKLAALESLVYLDGAISRYRVHDANMSLSGGIRSSPSSRLAWCDLLMPLRGRPELNPEWIRQYQVRTRALCLGNPRRDALPHLLVCAEELPSTTNRLLLLIVRLGVDGRLIRPLAKAVDWVRRRWQLR